MAVQGTPPEGRGASPDVACVASGADACASLAGSRARHRRSAVAGAAIAAATVALVLLFSVFPVLSLLSKGVGEDLVGELASRGALIRNSVLAGAASAVVSTALALAISLRVAFSRSRARNVVVALVFASIISPPFVSSLAYVELFGRRGLVTHELLGLSVSPYGPVGVVVMQSVFFCAINVLLILSTIRNIDPSVIDAARDLGASPSAVARRVVVPLALPSVGACLLLTFVRSLADYGTPVVIGGSFETISTAIYEQVVGYSDLAGAAILGILLCVVAVVVYACYAALIARSRKRVAGTATSAFEMLGDRRGAQMTLGGPLGAACSAVSWAFVAFMLMQYATIVHASLTQGISWTAPLTDANFRHLAEYEALPLARSLWFALASAAISCVLGFVCAYLLERGRVGVRAGGGRGGLRRKAQALLGFAITMPYMLPGTCVGLGYILAFNRPPLKLTGTAAIVVLVLAFKQLSISQQAFSNELSQLDPHLEEAARDVGATRLASALAVVVPSVRRAAAVSFMNAFSSAMVAYSAVLFLIAPGNKTAIFELFDQLSSGKYGQAAATSLVIVAITLAVDALLGWVFLGRRRRQHADA